MFLETLNNLSEKEVIVKMRRTVTSGIMDSLGLPGDSFGSKKSLATKLTLFAFWLISEFCEKTGQRFLDQDIVILHGNIKISSSNEIILSGIAAKMLHHVLDDYDDDMLEYLTENVVYFLQSKNPQLNITVRPKVEESLIPKIITPLQVFPSSMSASGPPPWRALTNRK